MSLFDDYLSALGGELGFSLAPEFSQVAFELDDLTIYLRYEEETSAIMGTVSVHDLGEDPTPQQQADLYIRILKGQYCFAETAGFSLSLTPDEHQVLLQGRWLLATLSDREFIDSFEAFVQTAKLWIPLLDEEGESSAEEGNLNLSESRLDMLRI